MIDLEAIAPERVRELLLEAIDIIKKEGVMESYLAHNKYDEGCDCESCRSVRLFWELGEEPARP